MVFGISAGHADESINGTVSVNVTGPSVTKPPVAEETAPQPAETDLIPAGTPLLISDDDPPLEEESEPVCDEPVNRTPDNVNVTDPSSGLSPNETPVTFRVLAAGDMPVRAAASASGNTATILLVSGTDTLTPGYTESEPANPLDTAGYSNGDWLPAAFATYSDTGAYWYPGISDPFGSGAIWISSHSTTEGGYGDQWRLYKTEFSIPEGSTVTSAQLWYTADNAVAVYLNDEEIAGTGSVYGTPTTGEYFFSTAFTVHFVPKEGHNSLKFVVRNWPHIEYNPTGLLYKAVIVYEEPEVYTFSVTNTKWDEQHKKMDANAEYDCEETRAIFKALGWKEAFDYQEGDQVTKGLFGANPVSGEHTLNEATLHYHVGHGGLYSNDKNRSFIGLINPDYSGYPLDPSEITQKWGGENKWVVLSSCLVLRDRSWKNAMGTTHGVLGFNTTTFAHPHFMTIFIKYAKTETVRDAYFDTVKRLFADTWVDTPEGIVNGERLTAIVYFKNIDQAENDYLPGMIPGKGIRPDALPNDYIHYFQWPLQSEVTVA